MPKLRFSKKWVKIDKLIWPGWTKRKKKEEGGWGRREIWQQKC